MGSLSDDIHAVNVDETLTAAFTLVFAGVVLLFLLLVVFRVAWSDKEEEDVHGKHGRRMRKILVVCLLCSDFVIA
jgi:hypothetical protein